MGLDSIFGGGGSSDGGAIEASTIQADAQREALEYLKENNALPSAIRDQSLTQLQAYYNNPTSTAALMDRAQSSGMTDMLLQGQEEAALRANAATGGLRGGQSISDVGSVQNQAMLQSYQNEVNRENQMLSGLSGLAGAQTNQNAIANLTSGIGQTQAMGITAANQNAAASSQAGFGNLMGLGQLGLGAYSSGLFSDDRLKDNITNTGVENGVPTYSWTWNDKAGELGLYGKSYGTLASEVEKINPDAVSMKDGYKTVNYEMIGVSHG